MKFKSKGSPAAQTIRVEVPLTEQEKQQKQEEQKTDKKEDDWGEKLMDSFEQAMGRKLNKEFKMKLPSEVSKPKKGFIEEVKQEPEKVDEKYITPKFEIVHRGHFRISDYTNERQDYSLRGVPEFLIVRIYLTHLVTLIIYYLY